MTIPTLSVYDAYGAIQTVNTTPNGGQATAPNSLPFVPASTGILAWTGTVIDMTNYGTVIINCMVAPSVAWTITIDDGININFPIATTAVVNTAGGISTASTIVTVGRYSLTGNCRVTLSGGTGGTFSIMGIN